jgi:hypothetical protein
MATTGKTARKTYLPREEWTAMTTFVLEPERGLALDAQLHTQDLWIKEGHTWIKVHITPRQALFTPTGARSGPAHPEELKNIRRATCYLESGEKILLEDSWRIDGHRPLGVQWTGTTEFEENFELGLELPTLRGKPARGLSVPYEPTQQEKELHDLTHVPFQPWCTICVRAKGRADHHRRKELRSPAVQIDYNFASTHTELNRTILTCCDVTQD